DRVKEMLLHLGTEHRVAELDGRHLLPVPVVDVKSSHGNSRYSSGGRGRQVSLISTCTPEERSSFMSASTVCGVGSRMPSKRRWVRRSNCSRDFLSTCGPRRTVHLLMRVGSGKGPRTSTPERRAVSTISRADLSRSLWSYALRRMRILLPVAMMGVSVSRRAKR